MKKILITCAALIIIVGSLVYERYSKNPLSIIPYPFVFQKTAYSQIDEVAPILIIGDKLGARLGKFKKELAQKLSVNLTNPIKISNLANEGDNIHRTLKKIKSLKKMPLIIIYLGGSDEQYESVFQTSNLQKINRNYGFYQDDRVKTALMIWPILSRFIYQPIKYTSLATTPVIDVENYPDHIHQKRSALSFKLFESALDELYNLARKRNILVIPITPPLNLNTTPVKSCDGTLTDNSAQEELISIKQKIDNRDYKAAINLSQDFVMINPSHSEGLYYHGQILKHLNRFKESQSYLEQAIAFDCRNGGRNPIYNALIKKVSKKYKFNIFDFHQYLADESKSNYVFIDETYPQDLYMERLVDFLALSIKKKLKL